MENISGFVRVIASFRVRQEWHKPLLRKPFVKYGQCLVMASYFFQLGGILGGRYRDKLEEFALAFVGLTGEAGAVGQFYGEVAKLMLPRVADCSTIFDYVNGSQAEKLDFKGDVSEILFHYGMQKVNPESATQMCCNYAQEGSVLGAIYPGHFKRLFEETYKKRDEETWQLFRASGLDIPEQQDVIRYDEVEQGEAETFLAYCQECAPSLYVSLSSA